MAPVGFDFPLELFHLREYACLTKKGEVQIMNGSIYKIIEVVGTSKTSWEDAAKNAVETAAKTLEDLRIAEIIKLDLTIDKNKVTDYRARVALSFKYHEEK